MIRTLFLFFFFDNNIFLLYNVAFETNNLMDWFMFNVKSSKTISLKSNLLKKPALEIMPTQILNATRGQRDY